MRSKRAVALALLLAVAGCSSRPPSGTASPSPSPAGPFTPTPVPVHVLGVGSAHRPTVLTETKNNRRRFTVRALSMEGNLIGTDGAGVFSHPQVTFVDKSGAITVAVAPKATVQQRDNSIDMTGGVHARTADGGVLTCDDLRYDANRERLYGEGHVVLTGPNGLQLRGDHLDGDVRLHDVRVTSGDER